MADSTHKMPNLFTPVTICISILKWRYQNTALTICSCNSTKKISKLFTPLTTGINTKKLQYQSLFNYL